MHKSVGADSGFTLMEIMLAILILGMVVAMVSVSLSGSINVIEATMDRGELYYRAQIAMERISEDLTATVLPANVEFIGKGEENDDAVLLSFASMAHLVFDVENGKPGMGIIRYGLQPDEEESGQLLLLRSDTLCRPTEEGAELEEEETAFLLSDRLRSVKFAFLDREGETLDSWDSTVREEDLDEKKRQLPAAVSCTLEYWLDMEEEISIIFQSTFVLPVGLIQPEEEDKP